MLRTTFILQRIPTTLCTLLLTLALVGCDKIKDETTLIEENLATTEAEIMAGGPALTIDSVHLSEDHRQLKMQIERYQNLDQHFLGDTSSVRIQVKEFVDAIGLRIPSRYPAKLTETHFLGPHEIDSLGITVTCILDLTLDYNQVERQRHAINDIRGMFKPERLQLRLITDEGLSAPYSCTDYILNTHVVPTGTGYKQLYRHILTAINQLRGRMDAIILMSDGKVYDEDLAMDDNHFAHQEKLYNICTRGESVSSYPLFFYYNLNPAPATEAAGVTSLTQESESLIKMLTDYTGGFMTYDFKGNVVMGKVLARRGLDFSRIDLVLTQPEDKTYFGSTHDYVVEMRDAKTDSLLASVSHKITLGTITRPVYTKQTPTYLILCRGLFVTVLLLLILFLLTQFIVPWLRFRYFKYRYIGRYHGLNTYIGGHIVEEQCYYCKGNFDFGDEVVAACSHTMHSDCWAENDYRCPEHGHDPKCKDSHHYYNIHNLLDPRNGHYSLEWLIYTALGSFVIWIITNFVPEIPGMVVAATILTMTYSALSIQRTSRYSTWCYIIGRGLIALVLVSIIYALIHNLNTLYKWTEYPGLGIFLSTLSCTITFAVIAYCSTYDTLNALRPKRILVALTALLIVEVLFSIYVLYAEDDIRIALFLNSVISSFILCAAICYPRSRSLHYFLHCEGSTKPLDIALYKWFNASPMAEVRIGSSVECELQLMWDLQSGIAPIQARIYQRQGRLYLEPLEAGVFDGNGRPLAEGGAIRLYHGYRFSIGSSNFSYIEKDKKK